MDEKKGVATFLTDHADRDPVSFHMPGHKGSALYRRFGYDRFLDRFFDCDITEIIGADNLFQPEEIIAETMAKYRRLYDSRASYLLVNGTSGGIIASILASVPPGKKLIMARNCHKSVFNALMLGGIQPVYAYPSEIKEYGIAGPIEPEEIRRLLAEEPDAEAVILPSPNYYGICSDIRAIAEVVHAAGKVLIVDQAHGAHLKFFEDGYSADVDSKISDESFDPETSGGSVAPEIRGESVDPEGAAGLTMSPAAESSDKGLNPKGVDKLTMPPAAESSGADLVINSTHKTLGSLTQSAVLNVGKDGLFGRLPANLYRLEDKLQAVESTSPSYILMGSLDINADILQAHAPELIGEWRKNLLWFYRRARSIPGLKIMGASGKPTNCNGMSATRLMDLTKINLDMSDLGLDGGQLEQALLNYGIYAELVTGDILMCMTGIGNTRRDYQRLLQALEEISDRCGPGTPMNSETRRDAEKTGALHRCPDEAQPRTQDPGRRGTSHFGPENEQPLTGDPGRRGAFLWTKRRNLHEIPTEKVMIPIDEAKGRVCASSIIPYPPGIPLICPGEEIGAEEIAYVKELRKRGEKVMGIDGEDRVTVGL